MAKKSSNQKTKVPKRSGNRKTSGKKRDNTDIFIGLLLLLLAAFITIGLASFLPKQPIEAGDSVLIPKTEAKDIWQRANVISMEGNKATIKPEGSAEALSRHRLQVTKMKEVDPEHVDLGTEVLVRIPQTADYYRGAVTAIGEDSYTVLYSTDEGEQEETVDGQYLFWFEPGNWGGALGYYVGDWLYRWLGFIAWLIPVLLLLWGFNRLLRKPAKKLALTTLTGSGFAFLVQITLSYFLLPQTRVSPGFPLYQVVEPGENLIGLGGLLGKRVFVFLTGVVGKLGLGFILGFLLIVAIVLIFDINLHKVLVELIENARVRSRERKEQQAVLADEQKRSEEAGRISQTDVEPVVSAIEAPETAQQEKRHEPVKVTQRIIRDPMMNLSEKELALAELLDPVPEDWEVLPDREIKEGAKLLVKKLAEFGVEGKVGDIIPGPVITRYEFHPAPGIKLSRIFALSDDLSLALKAERIRILPIPGKSAVGVEIPNPSRKSVPLRMIVGSRSFQNSASSLTLALGTSITGVPEVADLASIPHLLIAGTTGSGKSVCIHSLLTSILIKSGPDKVRFMAIDPKRLELPAYNPIPHLIQPTIVDPRKAANSLELIVKIMEERYKEFSRVGVRDIAGYNAQAKTPKPYIVVVVDELADLMLTAPSEIEQRIIRLAQMARAVGIHLVLATQRPSVDVITGLIKANFPGRIAFQVASKTDSRTILDMNGAEALLGRGDMLFLPPGKGEPVRLHGSFVSTAEANRIVAKLAQTRLKTLLTTQVDDAEADELTEAILSADLLDPLLDPGEPLYETKRKRLAEIIGPELLATLEGKYYPQLDEVVHTKEEMERKGEIGETDEHFAEAARLAIRHKEASVSMLQRRLNVGWARAGRIIDQLEQAGIVGPYEGSKSRKVFIQTEDELNKILKSIGES